MDTKPNPKISVAIPIYNMRNADFFLRRLLESLEKQTFRDFEIVITKDGKMAENTNSAIKKSKGEIIKILYMDDYLANPLALQTLADNFKGGWLASACVHDRGDGNLFNPHKAQYNQNIHLGENTIGSPSVIAVENNNPPLFDERMSWLLDCDYYKALYERYGEPTILYTHDVAIGCGSHQMTHILTDQQKMDEHNYVQQKYDQSATLNFVKIKEPGELI